MAILIPNSGVKIVANIAARNALVNKYEGLTVIVRDAIGDPVVGGSYEAMYRWNTISSNWVLIHKDAQDVINFTTESKTIVNGKVTSDFVPQTAAVISGAITDANGLELANVKAPAVVDNEISLGTNDYDGMTFIYTYAYGAVQASIKDISGVQSNVEW